MAAIQKIQKDKQPWARLPRYDENPYAILDPTEASAQVFDTIDSAYTPNEARQRGIRLIKTASVIAGLGLSVIGLTEFTQSVLGNGVASPNQPNTPSHTQIKNPGK